MPVPSTSFTSPAILDPQAEHAWVIPCETGLDDLEEIASYTLTLLAPAVALGLTIMSGSGRDHALVEGNQSIKVWFKIDPAFQANAAFDGAGTDLPFEVTYVTNSVPSNKENFTCILKVVHQ